MWISSFSHLWTTHVSSSGNDLPISSVHFSVGGVCVCPFLTDYKSTLFMIDTESFSVMWIANLFSQSVGDCLSLCGVFCYLKVFNYY